jgi:alpha-glucosidase
MVLAACSGGGSSSGGGDGGESSLPKPVDIATSAAQVRVTVPLAGVFRVQLSQSDTFPQIPSFAVDPAALSSSADFTVDTTDAAVTIHSGSSALRVTKSPLTLALLDGSGNVVAEEAAPIAWADQTGGATVSWRLGATEHVYGLGDKANGMDRRGKSFKMWNTDHYQWSPSGANSDPLYKSIPDFLFLSEAGVAHGLFIDNPSRATVDVGQTDSSVFSYAAERAGIKGTPSTVDLYVMAGPDPRTVITSYTALTGRTPLPPRWSLGYNQSRYSYVSEAETREVASRLRADSIPTDVIWLDLKYQQNNAPFTIDHDKFPNFSGMISDFSANGLNTVLIVDPHIRAKEGEPQYDKAISGDLVVKNPDGTPLLGGVWPFRDVTPPYRSIFPEFTLASTRQWWGTLLTTFSSYGVAGFWNDMNEPSIPFDPEIFPEGTMHDATPHRLDDGTTADHVLIHNVYGLLNARATYEGELALRSNTRLAEMGRDLDRRQHRFARTPRRDDPTAHQPGRLRLRQRWRRRGRLQPVPVRHGGREPVHGVDGPGRPATLLPQPLRVRHLPA